MFMYHGIDPDMNQESAPARKKVLYVVTKSNFGGAQRYVFDLATSLPKDAYEVVVAAGAAQGSREAGELLARLTHAGIRTVFVPQMQRDVSIIDFSVFRALLRLMKHEKPDVVHLNSSKAGAIGSLAARIARVPRIVFTVHGWAFREARNPLSRLLIYKVSLLTALFCHRVLCVTQFDMRVFAGFPLIGAKFVLVRNGVDLTQPFMSRDEAQKELGGARDGIWIGSIGELTYNKNIKTALDALVLARKSEPRLFYTVIGDGEQREQLARYAARKQLAQHVHFAGYKADAARLLPAFDIFLLPSRKEGMPYVLLEAARAQIAVVAASVGGIPELVESGVSGALCEPTDTMGIADSIVELATDSALRERFSRALAQKVEHEHSLPRMLSGTAAQY